MTRKDFNRIAAAIKSIAVLPGADKATIDAVAQALAFEFDETAPVAFRTACTGRINLSGRDEMAAMRRERHICAPYGVNCPVGR